MRNCIIVFLIVLIVALAAGLILYLVRSGKLFSSADNATTNYSNQNSNNQNVALNATGKRIRCNQGKYQTFFQGITQNSNQASESVTFKFKTFVFGKCGTSSIADECTTKAAGNSLEQLCSCNLDPGKYCFDLYLGGNPVLKDKSFIVTQDRQIIKASY